jgi:hypothetical protein
VSEYVNVDEWYSWVCVYSIVLVGLVLCCGIGVVLWGECCVSRVVCSVLG